MRARRKTSSPKPLDGGFEFDKLKGARNWASAETSRTRRQQCLGLSVGAAVGAVVEQWTWRKEGAHKLDNALHLLLVLAGR